MVIVDRSGYLDNPSFLKHAEISGRRPEGSATGRMPAMLLEGSLQGLDRPDVIQADATGRTGSGEVPGLLVVTVGKIRTALRKFGGLFE
jgi:hypothetical protein